MIVLDTNQLHATGVEQGTTLTLLRGVAHMTGHQLAIPVMVEQEYLASYRRDVETALRGVEKAADQVTDEQRHKLLSLVSWWVGRSDFARKLHNANVPVVRDAVERRQLLLHGIFRQLPTPPGADTEGNNREVQRRPPAMTSGRAGKGSRDTVI